VNATTSHTTAPGAARDTIAVSVVIVNYESWADVASLVKTLAESVEVRDGRWEVIVVDNASRGDVPPALQSPSDGVRVIFNSRNVGFAAGVNLGSASARGAWILLLNPDVAIDVEFPGQVRSRIAHYEARPSGRPGIVGFALRNEDGSAQPSVGVEPSLIRSLRGQLIPRARRKYRAASPTIAGEVPWVTGACVLIDAEAFRHGNGMDEDFFLYYEEVALCRTLRSAGRSVEFDPAVTVTHLRPLQNRRVSPRLRVITRHSKLVYFSKHRPTLEFALLRRVVLVEAAARRLWARACGDEPQRRCWELVGRIAKRLGNGQKVAGREVMEWTEILDAPRPGLTIHPAHDRQGSHHAAGQPSRSV
jgi:GT2 family glycosyltransferase